MLYILLAVLISILIFLLIPSRKKKRKTKGFKIFLKDNIVLEVLKKTLLEADLGSVLVEEILEKIKNVKNIEEAKTIIRELMFSEAKKFENEINIDKSPFVIMLVGVNGVGKTTMAAKLANYYKNVNDKKVILIGADTFRAGAVEQLEHWSKKISCDFFSKGSNTDSGANVFEGISYAKSLGSELIIIDTGGRLHNKENLMHEIQKLDRVVKKQIPEAPHLTLMVIDATMGQNVIKQSRVFNDFLKISGLALTKLDGTAKGGTVFNIAKELSFPVYFIGIGENLTDLKKYTAEDFVKNFI